MSLIRWRPRALFDPFEEMDKFFNDDSFGGRQRGFVPSVDVYQTDNNVVVETPLAGVNPDDVEVSIEDNILTIKGETQRKSETDDENFYRKEVRYGSFQRQVAIPAPVQEEKAIATSKDGMLKITVPKATEIETKSHKITINKE
ncbi:MAG: Hsp20/alpha crystallin family protein [Patescibacteria group bacterium]|nr:Hsp20/alpha crystallin family protein [Patescibacteria group bacterium]